MERLRAIPADFAPTRLQAIDERLGCIASEHDVAIGLAIESGSRAWGFPSPDSDYDCRFIFIRRRHDYLSPWQKRDVIETPLVDDFDINGWELAKTLKLMLKGNAVAIEWLMSPIVYDGASDFRTELRQLAEDHVSRAAILSHYLHLGRRQRDTYFADGKDIALKKIFYALRPAAALRWMRLRPEARIAPMHFPTLMAECDAPADVREIVSHLVQRKAQTRELGAAALPEPLKVFIDGEFERAQDASAEGATRFGGEAKRAAERFFREWVTRSEAR